MENKTTRIENSIGWRLAIFALIAVLAQFVTAKIFNLVCPDFVTNHSGDIGLILPVITVDLIGVPVICLLMRKLPKNELGHEKFSVGKFILGIPVMSMIVVAGSLLGGAIQLSLTPSQNGGLAEVLTGSTLFWRVLYVGILAPVFEELIFRKLLIDRLSFRGKWFAIFVSALCFGLFHGNFSQFFYAFGLGIIWGVIYTRTGKIYISMGYHLIINLSTSVIGVVLMGLMEEGKPETMIPFYSFVGVRVLSALVGIIVFAVFFKRIFKIEEDGLKGGELFKASFTSWGLWIFYAVCIGLFIFEIVSTNKAAAEASVDTKTEVTYNVTVNNGEADTVEAEIPFTISEAGNYIVSFDWYKNEEPGFITGARIVNPDGTTKMYSTGALLSAEMSPAEFAEGEYKAVFTFLINEEDYAEYILAYDEEPNPDISCGYEKLGQDGTYELKIKLNVLKTVK